jgi:hypothetical protein
VIVGDVLRDALTDVRALAVAVLGRYRQHCRDLGDRTPFETLPKYDRQLTARAHRFIAGERLVATPFGSLPDQCVNSP